MPKKATPFEGPINYSFALANSSSISEFVNNLISSNKTTAKALANHIGMSEAQMNKLTSGKINNPSAIQLIKLAKSLNLSIDFFSNLIDHTYFEKLLSEISLRNENDEQSEKDAKIKLKRYCNLIAKKEKETIENTNFDFDGYDVYISNMESNVTTKEKDDFLSAEISIDYVKSIDLPLEASTFIDYSGDYDDEIKINTEILGDYLNLPSTYETNYTDLSASEDSNKNIGIISLEPRIIKDDINYTDDIKDFLFKFIDIISNSLGDKNYNSYYFLTTSKSVYDKIKNKFNSSNIFSSTEVKLTLVSAHKIEIIDEITIVKKNLTSNS